MKELNKPKEEDLAGFGADRDLIASLKTEICEGGGAWPFPVRLEPINIGIAHPDLAKVDPGSY